MGSYKWVISRITIVISTIRGLVTLVITTHEPPSAIRAATLRGCMAFQGFEPCWV